MLQRGREGEGEREGGGEGKRERERKREVERVRKEKRKGWRVGGREGGKWDVVRDFFPNSGISREAWRVASRRLTRRSSLGSCT